MDNIQIANIKQELGLIGLLFNKLLKGRVAIYCIIVIIIAVFIGLFHLYMGFFGLMSALLVRPIHVVLFLALIFLYPRGSIGGFKADYKVAFKNIIPAIAILSVGIYYVINHYELMLRGQSPVGWDYFFGILFIVLLLEATRRVVGFAVPAIAIFFLFYAFEGRLFPGALAHAGFSLHRVIGFLFLSAEGIFGVIVSAMVSYIVLFVLFGTFLEKTGGSKFFMDFSNSISGRTTGGPGKTAVISSGLMGMVSGSAVANAATTGAFTIPTMKRMGFSPVFAGAVETVASSGGQIMPPIMGAAAFIMAEILGIPYIKICIHALVPAILYYVVAFAIIHFESKKRGLLPLPKDQVPKMRQVLLSRGFLFIPLFLLIYLLVRGYSPMFTVVYTISLLVVMSMFKKETRLSFQKFLSALEIGSRNAMTIIAVGACAGIIAGTINLTGLSASMSSFLIAVSGGNLYIVLFLTMIAALILGMGMPTVAVYVILGTLMAPTLTDLGLPEMASHLFVFYFGIASGLTPPVCTVAFTASAISGASPMRTGFASTKLGIAIFILPWLFIFNKNLLLMGKLLPTFVTVVAAFIGCLSIAAGMQGWFKTKLAFIESGAMLAGGILLLIPGFLTKFIGIILIILGLIRQIITVKPFLNSRSQN